MTKADLFYHVTRHLLNNKYAHIMVNESNSTITQVNEKKEGYTNRNIKRDYGARRFQHITVQLIKRILHAFNNNIL